MLTDDCLADEIATLAAHINAATCRWLELVAEFDRREAWGRWGARSCAEWLSWRCSLSAPAARDHVRVARRLRDLPLTQAAFARGELSFSKVRALTRVDGVVDEQELLDLARTATAAQLDRIVGAYRGVAAVEAGHHRAHERRNVTWHYDDDGSLVLKARLPAEEGAIVVAALEAARDELNRDRFGEAPIAGADPAPADPAPARVVADGPEALPAVTNADALVHVADRALGGHRLRTGGDRYQVLVEVDAATLAGTDGATVAVTGDGVAIPRETARRLACDASLVPIGAPPGKPPQPGRRTRTIPPSIRRALTRRDRGCRFPGCTRRRHVDAHHVEHWADGGQTCMENLVQLCRRHHRLVHEDGYECERLRGQVVFRRPDGRALEPVAALPRGCAGELAAANHARQPAIGPDTAGPHWDGTPLDLDLAVQAMLHIAPPPPIAGAAGAEAELPGASAEAA